MENNQKSTIQTSRKVYAMKMSFAMILSLTVLYGLFSVLGGKIESIVFVTALGAIGGIVSTLNIADGMKKGE